MLLDGNFFARHPGAKASLDFGLRSQILADRDTNIFQCFLARRALAIAAREIIAPNGKSLLRFHKRHVTLHYRKMYYPQSSLKTFFEFAKVTRLSSV